MKKILPIGISDFKKLRDEGHAYIDKTLLVQELVERGGDVALILRPRRFGKTLNLSMLRYFFEKTNQDMSYLFTGLNIWEHEKYRALQGQFPVVFISLKDVKEASWEETLATLRILIAAAFRPHEYLLEGSLLSDSEKEEYQDIVHKRAEQAVYSRSLYMLTEWLSRYYKKRVVLLIDEYDTPIHAAYVGGFYDTLILFLRNWLSGGLKDNPYLERGVLTGILRIAKESIFSGLNNISTFSMLSDGFQDKFGFLESEVQALAAEYGLSDTLEEMRNWYNGYKVGFAKGVYNPWSVLLCIESKGTMAPYWVNTSENAIMTRCITQGTDIIKKDIEALMQGTLIEKRIEEGVIFSTLYNFDGSHQN